MAEEKVYPKNIVKQTDVFADKMKFKVDIFESIKDLLYSTTKEAFESLGYKEKEGVAGFYSDDKPYGEGTALGNFNIKVNAKMITPTYIEKVIYFGGKKTVSIINIDYNTEARIINMTYQTSEDEAFRGYGSPEGPHLINEKTSIAVKSMESFKKEIAKMLKGFAMKEVKHITSTKLGVEDKTQKSTASMVENKFSLTKLFNSNPSESNSIIKSLISETASEEEAKKKKKEKDLLFSDLTEEEKGEYKKLFQQTLKDMGVKSIKDLDGKEKSMFYKKLDKSWTSRDEKEGMDEITTAGGQAVGAIGGQTGPGEPGTAGAFKYAANPFSSTPYAQAKKKRKTPVKMKNEGDSFWSTVELVPTSGYVPKGMEHNYVSGQHSKPEGGLKGINKNMPKESVEPKPEVLSEALQKRKFVTLDENLERGVNKRYIITEKKTAEEEKAYFSRLIGFEKNSTIESLNECAGDCNCGCKYNDEETSVVSPILAPESENLMERNNDVEPGEYVDGRKVIVVEKPGSLSGIKYHVYEDSYLNENKAYLLDLRTGGLIENPNFKAKK